ncbi:hypothetical protein DFH28DRAFT_1145006 [Melampsora americana]|nr:hypothetical protein DFH28DRAFT_1145006 [Melampsora americana]
MPDQAFDDDIPISSQRSSPQENSILTPLAFQIHPSALSCNKDMRCVIHRDLINTRRFSGTCDFCEAQPTVSAKRESRCGIVTRQFQSCFTKYCDWNLACTGVHTFLEVMETNHTAARLRNRTGVRNGTISKTIWNNAETVPAQPSQEEQGMESLGPLAS